MLKQIIEKSEKTGTWFWISKQVLTINIYPITFERLEAGSVKRLSICSSMWR